jgi:sodium transport system ATP-binding protein
MIEAVDLYKSFGTTPAVVGAGFSARDSQITGLLGPNGAGKTTILRMMCALMRADRGKVLVDGIDVGAEPMRVRQRLGVLPDARGLYKHLSVRENVEYFARLHGASALQARAQCDRILRALQMEDLAERRTEGFSQGERLKTAIARALVHDPHNVLLDEPTNGLDIMATRSLRETLRGLRAEGRCVLLSTHIMQEVAALCDHIVVLAHGRVVAQGAPDELRALAGHQNLEEAFVALVGTADWEAGS